MQMKGIHPGTGVHRGIFACWDFGYIYIHLGELFFFFFLNNNRKCTMDLPAVKFFVMVKYGFQWGHYPLKIPFKLSPSIKSFHVFGGLASSSTVSLKGFFPNIRPLDKWFRFMPAELISQKKHECFLFPLIVGHRKAQGMTWHCWAGHGTWCRCLAEGVGGHP